MAVASARKSHIGLFRGHSPLPWKSHDCLPLYFSTATGNIKKTSLIVPPAFDSLILKYQFSPQTASKIAHLRNPKKPESVLSFLKESGLSNNQLEKLVRYDCRLLSYSLEKRIKPKFKIFRDLGFSAGDATEIVASDPSILKHSAVNRIIPSLSVLKGLLSSNARVAKLLMKPGCYMFSVDLEKTLLPNIEFLKSCGVPMEQINSLMSTFPNFFFLNPEKIRKFVHKVDEMGVERTSKTFIYAVRAVSSMAEKTWELKLKSLRDLGFSEDDILKVFRSAPGVFAVSMPKMKKVKEVLLETGKYDASCIVNCPVSLTYSVEKRYKPRLQVLKVLEKTGLIDKWPSLSTLCSMSDQIFFQKFVVPDINEVGEAFNVKTAISDKGETDSCS